MIKVVGVCFVLISVRLFLLSINFKGEGFGAYITNIRFLVASIITFIVGVALIISDKSFCEVFQFLC